MWADLEARHSDMQLDLSIQDAAQCAGFLTLLKANVQFMP